VLKKEDILNNRYKIIRQIGQGGTAKTYLARDSSTNKEVVLKVVDMKDLTDWKVLELFKRETKVLKALDHPNIPDYIDNFQINQLENSLFVLVQEFIDGSTIKHLIMSGHRFSNSEIIDILMNLLEILVYIHNLKPAVIHRDINPKNIIITKEGTVFLVDFGAVGSIVRDAQTAGSSNTFVGTIGYMAQE